MLSLSFEAWVTILLVISALIAFAIGERIDGAADTRDQARPSRAAARPPALSSTD